MDVDPADGVATDIGPTSIVLEPSTAAPSGEDPHIFMLNASNLIHSLKCFECSSGLKVNISKSRFFGVGVPISDVEQVGGSIRCAFDKLPFMYLGLLVGRSMRARGGWNDVVDRFNARLSA
ncbi:RNA-directed DNA polymerase, eukaryota [Artemisia annua]|uniref:RNA-directed DNA polymerase, eukaryota n=1 Tax=Artemisia annua TaxID=35608 RepID=A0A2U1KXC4_ARTAN|nr:RNA-directed DNA polymerase, eukaryota [Artemisia annua]